MKTKRRRKRPPAPVKTRRETPLPSRWGRSKAGRYFRVVICSKRDYAGRKQYRMHYPEYGVTSSMTWTREEILATGCRWLKNEPKQCA